jgi:Carboxypeptidase regulatory-like domain
MKKMSLGTALFERSAVRVVLLCILITGLGWSSHAQSTATLQGTVSDPTGAAVPGAKVTVTNQGTNVHLETTSDSAGAYLFSSLPIGLYKLEVSGSGFQTITFTGLKLDVASTVTRNVQLKLGETTQTVEVNGGAPLVETSSNTMGQVLNDKYVQQIPLNGRHFTDLSLLTPGTITPPANGFLSFPLRGQGSFGINTAGQREDTTNWLVNGINLNDLVQNQITFQPPIDTLAEYRIDNSSFPAQYGRNSGAIVNLATRSGTNDIHGELFEFFRNNALDARNFFNPGTNSSGAFLPQAPFNRNDFGFDVGGPIIKNKLFFFLAYEGLRQHQSISLSTPVPSVDDRTIASAPAIVSLLGLIPAANLVGTGNPADPNTFNLFSGGVVANVSLDQGSADIDYELSANDRLHGYYVVQKDLREEPTAGGAIGANLPEYGDTRYGFRQLMTFSEDHTFSPSISNTVRLGFNRIHLTFTPNALLNPADFNMILPEGSPVSSGCPLSTLAARLDLVGRLQNLKAAATRPWC